MLMAGESSIRDVIAFPKTQSGSCPLTDAPSTVPPNNSRSCGCGSYEGRTSTRQRESRSVVEPKGVC